MGHKFLLLLLTQIRLENSTQYPKLQPTINSGLQGFSTQQEDLAARIQDMNNMLDNSQGNITGLLNERESTANDFAEIQEEIQTISRDIALIQRVNSAKNQHILKLLDRITHGGSWQPSSSRQSRTRAEESLDNWFERAKRSFRGMRSRKLR